MKHRSPRRHFNLVTCQPITPAKIEFLHVHEEIMIQTAYGLESRLARYECGAGCPKDRDYVLILPEILFDLVKDSAPNKRKTVCIYEAPRASGILKILMILIRLKLRLDGGKAFVAFKQLDRLIQPI